MSVAWRWLSFRDLHEAVEAAKDGDRIVLLPGTHNTGARGVPVVIAKRVLIMGEAGREGVREVGREGTCEGGRQALALALTDMLSCCLTCPRCGGDAEAVIDHRGNRPLFRIDRSCVIRDVVIDMTGYKVSICMHAAWSSTVSKRIHNGVSDCMRPGASHHRTASS